MRQVVNAIIGIIETAFLLRLMLEFFGANPSSEFVAWLYGITNSLAGPFMGAFPSLSIGSFVINVSIILAMICYAILGWLILLFLSFVFGQYAQ